MTAALKQLSRTTLPRAQATNLIRTQPKLLLPRMASSSSESTGLKLSQPLPINTVDAHSHIIPPDFDRFPIHTGEYKPTPHTISDAIAHHSRVFGLSTPLRLVLTQVSVYGNDNSALLSGLDELASQAQNAHNRAGIITADPGSTQPAELDQLWERGVRGIRTNLVSVSAETSAEELRTLLQSQIDLLARTKTVTQHGRKWVLDLFIKLADQKILKAVLPRLMHADSVRIVVAHFGGLKLSASSPPDPYELDGFRDMVEMLTSPDGPEMYIKLSAPYRVDKEFPSPEAQQRLDQVGRELIARAPNRCIWASDWPHTRFGEDKAGSVDFVEQCYTWCRSEEQREALFGTNSERLYSLE